MHTTSKQIELESPRWSLKISLAIFSYITRCVDSMKRNETKRGSMQTLRFFTFIQIWRQRGREREIDTPNMIKLKNSIAKSRNEKRHSSLSSILAQLRICSFNHLGVMAS